jgi:1-deoxy-D-xylulose-5-phosphate synthase
VKFDIKNSDIKTLEAIAEQIREKILTTVSKNGGHLSSTLGAVDLILAMHYVFDAKSDPFIFDVSHQAYAHKLLTDRWDNFETLRQMDGICGYTKPKESPYDYFVAGHSSTSISVAVGAAKAIALKEEDRVPVALIGDGSMTAGMVYEALNELGDRKLPVVIILNDNEMSIAKPIGAMSRVLSQAMASPFYQKMKKKTEQMLEHLPDSAHFLAKRFEESFKLITHGIIFEEFGLEYIGPIDGHNLESLIETFERAKALKKPVIVHTQTVKGKGYNVAEGHFEHWHGVGPFDIQTGESKKKSGAKAATAIYTDAMMALAARDEKVVGLTAAMPSGTGLSKLLETYPKRFWDVAIAEQHAVTSSAALAVEGFKPFCTIYSTFLQRGFDQVVHDVCLMNVGVAFAIDRAGIVGEDGETHQGVFDISYLRAIPNMTIFAPRDEQSLHHAVNFAADFPTPCAFRYPRGAFGTFAYENPPFELGKAQLLQEGESDILFIGYGNGVHKAVQTAQLMDNKVAIVDLRFVKPLDKVLLRQLAQHYSQWFVFSDSAKMGGVGSAILEFLADEVIGGVNVHSFEYEDAFIVHGKTADVEAKLGLLANQLVEKVNALLDN